MDGFTKIAHSVWEIPMEPWERYMLLFLLDAEDRFNCSGEWFCLTDKDFINAGFGSDKRRWKKYRDSLIQRGWITYEKGGPGRKSRYKFNRKTKED